MRGSVSICELVDSGVSGLRLHALSRLHSDVLADASPKRLKDLGELLSKRLSYLLEPISPIEVDAEQCVVQLRSNPPQQGDGQSSYYELLVRKGGEISLRRYTKPRASPARSAPRRSPARSCSASSATSPPS